MEYNSKNIKKKYQNRDFPSRHNFNARWTLIESFLPKEPCWFPDIGANNGDTQIRLSQAGHYSVGIEVDPDAAKRNLPNRATMMISEVNPDMISVMPKFAGIFFMSVFHRMWDLNGSLFAKEVLKNLGQRCHFMIFEGSSRHARYITQKKSEIPPFANLNEEDSIKWHYELLHEAIPTGQIKLIGTTTTIKTSDPRPLFYIRNIKNG